MKKNWTGENFRLGVLGGGQLGRMMIQEALNYDIHVHCLDPDPQAPCSRIASSFTVGSLTDFDTVFAFGKDKDVVTVEIEHVNIEAIQALQEIGIPVYPQPEVLSTIQDKGLQKEFYQQHQLPTAPFSLVNNKEELIASAPAFPFVLKLRKGGYDGKGVQIIRSTADFEACFDAPCVVETMIPFAKELSVIVARNASGQTAVYPTVECEFNPEANLVEFLFAPAAISEEIEQNAQTLALAVIDQLNMVGILAVEFFLTQDDQLLINEVAPRTHNSGHHTIECNYTSQFEQHLRSVIDAPLGSTTIRSKGVMINLLGEPGYEGDAIYENLEKFMALEGVQVHLYGKQKTKGFRKMGHVTIFGNDLEYNKKIGKDILNQLKIKA